ncbi:MAG: hypothetical protein EXX96DRAFT_573271 [Benjaminiella poitrasii]|nr:MAG: hypothetical protein EXX96DRAFT_573271 [Benjaminiella poitrasii]
MSSQLNDINEQTTLDSINNSNDKDEDEDDESDYSLDYEYAGPCYANHRPTVDIENDDVASELSDEDSTSDFSGPRYDMWEDDPYSDFTWESDDMQLTRFMKKQRQKNSSSSSSSSFSFWIKDKGWPRQLMYSCSSTNHDQSANAVCLVQSNYGLSECLYTVYRNRIIQCGNQQKNITKPSNYIDKKDIEIITLIDNYPPPSTLPSPPLQQPAANVASSSSSLFINAHQYISLSKLQKHKSTNNSTLQQQQQSTKKINSVFMQQPYITQFKPFTKYIQRADYHPDLSPTYLSLTFDPQCLAYRYGYLAVGGIEGELEVYCCTPYEHPVKIWGTKFKGKDNVMLMTHSIQISRFKRAEADNAYDYLLTSCMNEAGILFYQLPSHNQCQRKKPAVRLHTHLRGADFEGMPVNDAKLSPDGRQMVCVGDPNKVFLITFEYSEGMIVIGTPVQLVIPPSLLSNQYYCSQHVSWSASSKYFAQSSDSHTTVFVWRVATREMIYSIDATGYTYAIAFHPQLDHILTFTNRYGYFHTVDLSRASRDGQTVNILTFEPPVTTEEFAVFYNQRYCVPHEITMVSFRGETDKSLRILAKINGLEWSRDGRYLYVATKKRVLAYRFMYHRPVPTLLTITSDPIKRLLESRLESGRKRKQDEVMLEEWSSYVPEHVRANILGQSQYLACHW